MMGNVDNVQNYNFWDSKVEPRGITVAVPGLAWKKIACNTSLSIIIQKTLSNKTNETSKI